MLKMNRDHKSLPYLYRSGKKNSKSSEKQLVEIFPKFAMNNAYTKRFDNLFEKEIQPQIHNSSDLFNYNNIKKVK